MRVVALLATYNEERFVDACLDNLTCQGVEVYLIDNGSTDQTVAIAERYRGRGLVGIESFPRDGVYRWAPLLRRKQQLAASLDADWFMHVDADEIRLPPPGYATLHDALADADDGGFNAVNFMEFTFVPTRESPDHDHADFQRTLRWYYPFLPRFPHRLNAWKRQPEQVDLVSDAGHVVRFPGLRRSPLSFPMRHYLFLSIPHAIEKYVAKAYDAKEVASGWHRARMRLRPDDISLPSEKVLRIYTSDQELDPSDPRSRHFLFETATAGGGSASGS